MRERENEKKLKRGKPIKRKIEKGE